MANSNWEEQFKVFLKRAGEDLKRMGEDIRTEAQRLVTEMKTPERQEKVREGLRDLGQWAKRTANDVADLVEKGAQKAETAFRTVSEREQPQEEEPAPPTEAAPTPPTASRPEPTARVKKAPAPKTVGPKKRAAASKTRPAGTAAKKKKSIGRKPKT